MLRTMPRPKMTPPAPLQTLGADGAPPVRDPVTICQQRGATVSDQLVNGKGTYWSQCSDGYSCAFTWDGGAWCQQFKPGEKLDPRQFFPPPSDAAKTACAQHDGVWSETNPDEVSFHIICMDGYTCDGGAERETTCAPGTREYPTSTPGCQGNFKMNTHDGQGCRCMPGYAPDANGNCAPAQNAPGVSLTPTEAAFGGVNLIKVIPGLVLPGAKQGGTPGGGTTEKPSMLRRALPWVAAGVGAVAVGIGGKAAYDYVKRKKA